jgi:ferredoxin
MRVIVDVDRCLGHAQCEIAAPEVFRVSDEGTVELLQETPADTLADKVKDAVARCPERAITVDL